MEPVMEHIDMNDLSVFKNKEISLAPNTRITIKYQKNAEVKYQTTIKHKDEIIYQARHSSRQQAEESLANSLKKAGLQQESIDTIIYYLEADYNQKTVMKPWQEPSSTFSLFV